MNLQLLTYTSPILLLTGVVLGGYTYKYLDSSYRLMLFYLIGNLIIDVVSRFLGEFIGNNLILLSVLSVFELLVFSKFYFDLINRKKLIVVLATIGSTYIFFESAHIDANATTSFQPYAKVVTSFLIVILVLVYFIEQIKREDSMVEKKTQIHHMILGYFTLELILLLPINFLINSKSDFIFYIWFLHLMVLLIFYFYITYCIWMNGKSRKQLPYGL